MELRKCWSVPRRVHGKGFVAGVFLILALAAPCRLTAQNLTGEISGTVVDSTGAAVPGATVDAINAAQGTSVRKVTSDAQGRYDIPLLLVGRYSLSITGRGFEPVMLRNLEVHINTNLTVPVSLTVGAVSAEVTVNADTVVVDTGSSAASGLITGQQVTELGLNNRNFQQLYSLQPGIATDGKTSISRGIFGAGGVSNSAGVSVNGQRNTENNVYLDGESITGTNAYQSPVFFPSIDAIQEMTIVRNSYGAQYGGAGSGIIELTTKAGTDQFRGTVYYFGRLQGLNANGYFNDLVGTQTANNKVNDYGYSLGGPFWIPGLLSKARSKTFFFVENEIQRDSTVTPEVLTSIPTAAQKTGVFTVPVCVAYTGTTCTSTSTTVPKIDPTAQAYLTDLFDKIPNPNSPSDPQGLIASPSGTQNATQTMVRIDRQFSDKLGVFFRYIHDPYAQFAPYGIGNTTAVPGVSTSNLSESTSAYLGHATYTFTPTLLAEGGVSYFTTSTNGDPVGYLNAANSPDVRPTLPFLSTSSQIPSLSLNALPYTTSGTYRNPTHDYEAFVNVTKVRGPHSLQAGFQFTRNWYNTTAAKANAGNFTFTATGTGVAQFSQAFANFLIGHVATFTQASINPISIAKRPFYEVYFQDKYKASSRLTLDAGVRYLLSISPVSGGAIGNTSFDPQTFNPAAAPALTTAGLICTVSPCAGTTVPNPSYNPLNGIIVGGQNSPFGNAVVSQPKLNFAPRVGFAYDVFGDGKTSIRGGYGLYYTVVGLVNTITAEGANAPFVLNTTISNTNFDNPGVGGTVAAASPNTVQAAAPQWKSPYVQNWSLDIQRQVIKNGIADIGYYAAAGVHLLGIADINQPAPGAYQTAGVIAGGGVTTGNTALLNSLRPYVGYGAIDMDSPSYSSNYNSLQTSYTQRLKGQSVVNVSYTYSKALTNSQDDRGTAPQYYRNVAAEYGPAALNRKHVFTANFVYELPFFLKQHGVVGHVLGGFQLSGIVSAYSGLPFTAHTTGVDPGGVGLLATGSSATSNARPDQIANANAGAPHTRLQWFKAAAFANVPAGQYRPGDASVGSIVGPGTQDWDLDLYKNIEIRGRVRLQLRLETFNTFNHTNFNALSTTLSATNFGQVTGAGDARNLQLGAKLNF